MHLCAQRENIDIFPQSNCAPDAHTARVVLSYTLGILPVATRVVKSERAMCRVARGRIHHPPARIVFAADPGRMYSIAARHFIAA